MKRTLTKVTTNMVEEDEEIERPNKKTKQGSAVIGRPDKDPVGTKTGLYLRKWIVWLPFRIPI